jgi:lipid-A-disaccharide synthase
MLIAGEASGDLLAAELVAALREQLPDARFFGAGGAKMAAAGAELAFDLTQHAMIGVPSVGKLLDGRKRFHQLLALALERKPDAVIGVDYGFFNLRFGHAVRGYVRGNPFSKWDPKIVQFVSPQVWASRPGRAQQIAADYDLLLSIFPFEKDWYAQRVPQLRVEFVGHPMIGRFQNSELRIQKSEAIAASPKILLLPGSRKSELKRHLPVMLQAAWPIAQKANATFFCVLPNQDLLAQAKPLATKCGWPDLVFQIGELPWALAESDLAISKTGTVTMECAFFGVPTVTLYKTNWFTYQIGKRIVKVKSLTMPNLLAGEEVYPEFVQNDATPENLSRAALELLQDEARRQKIKAQLAKIIASLGEPGAPKRAAAAILSLLK